MTPRISRLNAYSQRLTLEVAFVRSLGAQQARTLAVAARRLRRLTGGVLEESRDSPPRWRAFDGRAHNSWRSSRRLGSDAPCHDSGSSPRDPQTPDTFPK